MVTKTILSENEKSVYQNSTADSREAQCLRVHRVLGHLSLRSQMELSRKKNYFTSLNMTGNFWGELICEKKCTICGEPLSGA